VKGPHGLNDIHLAWRPEGRPLFVRVYPLDRAEGLVYVDLVVYEEIDVPNAGPMRSTALCVYVEGDEETLREAKQWMLDMTALRTVPAGCRWLKD
jgi:hypothetical protein